MSRPYLKAEPKRLRDLDLDERWLQERINEDPSLLGLGDLVVVERERVQPTGGRIDFLMYDPEDGVRYETEIMLGRLDEAHIIRTIEYWDIERRRFPALQHRAVIVAEEITNRFFNIVSLLNQSVPIIAIQLSAFEVEGRIVLHFTTVLDLPEPTGEEDEISGEKVDRAYWEKRSNAASLALVDNIISLVPTEAAPVRPTYNKQHIAVGTSGQNFLWLHPRKSASHAHMHLRLKGADRDAMISKLEAARIYSGAKGAREMKVRIGESELDAHKELVSDLLRVCEANARD